jgi:hypothetical protein
MSEREMFEKWAAGSYLLAHNNGKYSSRDTRRAWEAWSAALQSAGQAQPAVPEADVDAAINYLKTAQNHCVMNFSVSAERCIQSAIEMLSAAKEEQDAKQ